METRGAHQREDVASWVSGTTMCHASVREPGRQEKEEKRKGRRGIEEKEGNGTELRIIAGQDLTWFLWFLTDAVFENGLRNDQPMDQKSSIGHHKLKKNTRFLNVK